MPKSPGPEVEKVLKTTFGTDAHAGCCYFSPGLLYPFPRLPYLSPKGISNLKHPHSGLTLPVMCPSSLLLSLAGQRLPAQFPHLASSGLPCSEGTPSLPHTMHCALIPCNSRCCTEPRLKDYYPLQAVPSRTGLWSLGPCCYWTLLTPA